MDADIGDSTKTTPPVLSSPVIDELTKNPTPTIKSTPKKCSSNTGSTHLLDGMHSYHALFPLLEFFPYNFSYFNYIPGATS